MKRYNTGIIIMSVGGIVASGALIGLMGVFASDEIWNKGLWYAICLVVLVLSVTLAIAGNTIAKNVTKEIKAKMGSYLKIDVQDNPDYLKEIETVRANFNEDTNPDKNMTLKPGFGRNKVFYDRSVIATGQIHYGYLVQANSELFHFKNLQTVCLPGVVIYSTDDYFDAHPLELKKIADALYANRRSNMLRHELSYFTAQRLPDELTDGRAVYITTIMFYRLHLPLGYLTDSLMPLVADPKHSAPYVVDVKYWTETLIGNFVHGYANKHKETDTTEI